jgi:hypothetical protein
MPDKKVHITFDYELFFGESSGSIGKCILEPTEKLIELAERKKVKFVFFVDAGFIFSLKRSSEHEKCKKDLELVSAQIKKLSSLGHEIALHVHPHWEDCVFEGNAWKIVTKRYKLSDFTENEIEEIITKYHNCLKEITGIPCSSFRAGGWCIQPFSKIMKALVENRIFIDSSVFKNGFHDFTAHSYDFTNAPDLEDWHFEADVCKKDREGRFKEIAITRDKISPLFYFSLYLKMRLRPEEYKPVGDGSWLKDKKKIYKQFYSSTNHFACCDGYFASRLRSILERVEKEGKKRMLVLGHPKSLANCSFKYLESFIEEAKNMNFTVTTLK